MSLAAIVFLIFLVLKLAGIGIVATWSWWLVTLPLWIGFAAVVVLGLIALIAGAGFAALKPKRKYFKRR